MLISRVSAGVFLGSLLVAATASCTLISLDSLQDGAGGSANGGGTTGGHDGSGGDGAGNAGGTSDGASSQGGAGGGDGGNGAGGGPTLSYADCIVAEAPSVYFSMAGPATEPNLGTLMGEGTYAGAFSFVAPLVTGGDGSVTFDAVGTSLLSYDGASPIFGGYKPFSIEAWIRSPETIQTRDIVRFASSNDRVTFELRARQFDDGLDAFALRIRNGAGGERQIVQFLDLAEPPNQVHHVVAVYRQTAATMFEGGGDADDMVLFIDGDLVNDVAGGDTISVPNFTGTLTIGAGLEGVLDEVAIYPEELSETKAGQHHAMGLSGVCSQ